MRAAVTTGCCKVISRPLRARGRQKRARAGLLHQAQNLAPPPLGGRGAGLFGHAVKKVLPVRGASPWLQCPRMAVTLMTKVSRMSTQQPGDSLTAGCRLVGIGVRAGGAEESGLESSFGQ